MTERDFLRFARRTMKRRRGYTLFLLDGYGLVWGKLKGMELTLRDEPPALKPFSVAEYLRRFA